MGVVKSTQGRELGVWAHPVPRACGVWGVFSCSTWGGGSSCPASNRPTGPLPRVAMYKHVAYVCQKMGQEYPAGTVCDRQEMPSGVCTLKTATHGHQGVREWLQGRQTPSLFRGN